MEKARPEKPFHVWMVEKRTSAGWMPLFYRASENDIKRIFPIHPANDYRVKKYVRQP